MAKKFFKENLLKVSSKKIEEIEKAVGVSNFSFKKMVTINNLLSYSFLFILINFLALAFSYESLPETIPLFYSRPWGTEQLADKQLLFLIPGLSFLFFLLNFSIIKTFLNKIGNFLSIMLSFVLFSVCLIGLIAVLKIISLII